MAALCRLADVITPNLTEACILSDTAYPSCRFPSEEEACRFAEGLLQKLRPLCKRAAVTGIEFENNGKCSVMTACAEEGVLRFFSQVKIGASYPGTGELFASVLLGMMLDGLSFFESAHYAGSFVSDTIAASDGIITEHRLGTALEPSLVRLAHDTYEKMNNGSDNI